MAAKSTLTTSATTRDVPTVPSNVNYVPLPPKGQPHATYSVKLPTVAEKKNS